MKATLQTIGITIGIIVLATVPALAVSAKPIGWATADAVAAHFGLPPPPRVAADTVDPEVAGMLTADRRIANRRMKDELGVVLRYPSWRSVLTDAA